MTFASRSVAVHLARGVVGLGALGAGVALGGAHPVLAVAAIVLGVVALRGCPLCWTMGLVETVAARVRGRPASGRCVDGTCSIR